MKIVIQANPVRVARGHAFGRAGAGRKTSFADRRHRARSTGKVRFHKDVRDA